MAESDVKVEGKSAVPSTPNNDVPNAFSKCANCSFSYQDSKNPVESIMLVCLHSFCKKCVMDGCLMSDKGDQSEYLLI